ncbi:glutamyl-tRNA amidotransferase subunit B [Sulfolobus acidocaldarius SUSAZ]|nr:glutamyl-tRNA amidotransferase subunit B [Sulfolobus acidocaldarius SUSAZ]
MVKIGLEVHVHLTSLKTKLFCSCPTEYVGKDPNTITCPVCLGLPGAIPVLNENAVRAAIMVALAINAEIADRVVMVRKHYFYPDMAKNYQISQYDGPGSIAISKGGFIKLRDNKTVRIRRINIEEDPAKIVYPTGSMLTSRYTLLDYNRSGFPLLEIVTEPDMSDPREAREFLEKLRSILQHLGISNPDLEGAMRADANISIEGGERVEIKNIGSPKEVEEALKYEIARQKALVAQGMKVNRETRHWDNAKKVTVLTRSKELEEDYRYFPDPDLPPYTISFDMIEKIRKELPELPDIRIQRLVKEYGITEYDANVLVIDKSLADLFEETAKNYKNYKKLVNILINDYLRWLNDKNLKPSQSKATTKHLIELLTLLDNGTITIKIAKEILPQIVIEGKMPSEIIKQNSLIAIKDEDYLVNVIKEVLYEEKDAVEKAKRDPKVINYLVGKVMKKTSKRADPYIVNELIKKELGI